MLISAIHVPATTTMEITVPKLNGQFNAVVMIICAFKTFDRRKKKIHVCSYKAVVLAVKFACTGEEHGASRHVDAHGERLCGKQRLGGEQKHEQTLRPSHDFSSYIINKSLHFVLFLFRCLKPARTDICIFCIIYIYKRSSSSSMTLC